MCGIAGMLDLVGKRHVPVDALEAMVNSLHHRGPDEDGFLVRPGMGMGMRRLSIVGLVDGKQPLCNEDRTVHVIANGELFDYPEKREMLEGRGHVYRTHTDIEMVPHLYEEHGTGVFEQLRGQFVIALWDEKEQRLLLGRDRIGICPLYYTKQDGWLLFASEIKGLLASGMVPARPDWRGIDHVFTFMSQPGPITCFAGIESVTPGHFLEIRRPRTGTAEVVDRKYWEIDYPDWGQEDNSTSRTKLIEQFEAVLLKGVERRLRADVPVTACLSGGVDSSLVVAMANKLRGGPIPTYTISVEDPQLDESADVAEGAAHFGGDPNMVMCTNEDVLSAYPQLMQAAESPVIDTAAASVLLLAGRIHEHGYKVTLTGQGADELMAGYIWFKLDRLLSYLDIIPGLRLSERVRRSYMRMTAPPFSWSIVRGHIKSVGGRYNAAMDMFSRIYASRLHFYSASMHERTADYDPYKDLGLNLDRMRRWHPLNQGLCLTARTLLPGMLLSAKGDRAGMFNSVEMRYPFLDEDVVDFCAKLHPRWKLHGLKDKYLLRRVADRWLPRSMSRRRKNMFLAPFEALFPSTSRAPAFVEQLLSPESLRSTGYFDPIAVKHWREAYSNLRKGSYQRMSIEMGLVGVVSTQLWHHTFIDNTLADLPTRTAPAGQLASTFS